MFGEIALLLAAQSISIPLGHPRVNEQPRAPIDTSGPLWAAACDGTTERNKAAPPVRIHANSYLVGTCGLSSMLIVGEQGDILIDGGEADDADLIADNIRQLGYSPSDIRYILHSDIDSTHLGGISKLQRLSGASVVASADAARLLRAGTSDENSGRVAGADRQRWRRGAARQFASDRDRHTVRSELAMGELRRRHLPDNRLCRRSGVGT